MKSIFRYQSKRATKKLRVKLCVVPLRRNLDHPFSDIAQILFLHAIRLTMNLVVAAIKSLPRLRISIAFAVRLESIIELLRDGVRRDHVLGPVRPEDRAGEPCG